MKKIQDPLLNGGLPQVNSIHPWPRESNAGRFADQVFIGADPTTLIVFYSIKVDYLVTGSYIIMTLSSWAWVGA